MIELLKRTVFAGIGAAVTTKERVQAMLQELVDKGKITRAEAKKMAEKIASDGKVEFERSKDEIAKNIQKFMSGRKTVTEAEFRDLESRVSMLEEREAAREQRKSGECKSKPAKGSAMENPPA